MKKSLKRTMSLLLATAMMIGMLSGISVSADFTQNPVINLFNTFHGYEKEAGVNIDEVNVFSPVGLRPYVYYLKTMSSEIDENDNTAIILNSGCQTALPFDEVISKGYMHISFDMKLPATIEDGVDKTFRVLLRQNLLSDSPIDSFNSYSEEHKAWVEDVDGQLLLAGNIPVKDENGNTVATTKGVVSNTYTSFYAGKNNIQNISLGEWHKYDFFFDFEAEAPHIISYIDGVSIGTTNFQTGVTGFAQMVFEPAFDNIYLDNIYAKHYLNADDNTVDMSLDFASDGVAQNDGQLNIAFSEALGYLEIPEFIPFAEGEDNYDFYAVNQATGKAYYATSGAVTNTGLKLGFDSLPAGYYTLKVNEASAYGPEAGEFYMGKITGKKIAGDATFYVKGDEKNNTNRRYYLNEDFNGYTGGMPIGAQDSSYGTYVTGTATSDNNGGTALKINSANASNSLPVIFDFPSVINDDKVYIEFDVKYNNMDWGVGIVEAADVAPLNYVPNETYDSTKTYTQADVINERKDLRRQSIFAGNWAGKTGGTKLGYALGAKSTDYVSTYTDNVVVPQGKWTTVKLVVDNVAKKYTLTVGDQSFTTDTWYNNTAASKDASTGNVSEIKTRYGRRIMRDINTGKQALFTGFGGFAIRAMSRGNEGESTEFDNIKVYTENSYNTYNTFDNMKEHTAADAIASWWNPEQPDRPTRAVTASGTMSTGGLIHTTVAQGTTSDASDKALQFTAKDNKMTYHPFNIPVKAGMGFDVEFDLKAGASSNVFAMCLMDTENLYTKDSNIEKGQYSWEDNLNKWSERGTSMSREQYLTNAYDENICLTNSIKSAATTSPGYYVFTAVGTDTLPESDANKAVSGGTALPFATDKWQHIKFSYIPDGDSVYYKLAVTVDGTTYTSQEFLSGRDINEEIGGIGFRIPTSGNNITIDNLKVSEHSIANNAYITTAYIVGINGVKRAFDGTFTNADEYVELNSSAALLNMDEIGLYDGSTNATVNVRKELSADKKSVKLYLSGLPVGKAYTVYVNPVQQFESSSYITLMEPFRKKVTIGTTEGSVVFESLRLCQDYGTKTIRQYGQIVELNLGKAPLASSVLKDKTDADLYLVAKGYNTGAATTANLIGANMIAERFEGATLDAVEIPSGRFAVEIPVTITTTQDIFKGFLWNDNLKPLLPGVEYSVINTVIE